MTTRTFLISCSSICIATIVSASAAAGPAPASAPAQPKPSAVIQPALPQSVFIIPKNASEGRGPFFPRSTRVYTPVLPLLVMPTTNAVPAFPTDIRLKGISGSMDHRLALINNHTFEAGEEAEVTTVSGRILVRCLQIREESVLIQVGPERRELRMRAGI
jgi:hypothetical protein